MEHKFAYNNSRSLAAAEQLSKAGYGQLAWINGGLDSAQKGDLDSERADDLRYGGIGGLSEVSPTCPSFRLFLHCVNS